LSIAVNVSPLQFRQGDIVALVHSTLLETGLAANRLTIEITESTLMVDFSHAVSILRRLKLLGVNVAMDDFGTGYSSLSYLRSIPFDKIKIDRSFIINLGKDPQASAIVRGVIDLVHSLGLTALAEGVETKEQLAALQEAGCEEVQGYLIGRPCPMSFYGHVVGDAPDQPSGDNVLPLAQFAGIQGRDRSSRARNP
jgi:EAL domain-containing protein (putative c-di-GMP-specific phosphodiesterase class I)